MKVLITGGAGYIGSTICAALEDSGHTPIIIDNLSRGKDAFTRGRIFYQNDITDENALAQIFAEHPEVCCTIHCAAFILVPESEAKPYDYYKENVVKSIELFRLLNKFGKNNIVFSSSASIYDMVPGFMVTESAPLKPQSPYARTKYMMEMILKDMCNAYDMRGISLRYFNPIGADPKMRSGIHDRFPSHVIGKLVEVALGKLPEFKLTGVEWPTRDGSGIRDYIHVWDLAKAHVKAVENFTRAFLAPENNNSKYLTINLGSGNGVTVKELVSAFEEVYGKKLPVVFAPPRPGDVAGAYANADLAQRLLGWKTELSIQDAIRDALKWGKKRQEILGYE